MLKALLQSITLGYLFVLAAVVVLAVRVAFPYHRVVALVLLVLSVLPFAYTVWRKHALFRAQAEIAQGWLTTYWPQLLFLVVIAVIAYVVYVLFPFARSPLRDLSHDELLTRIQQDEDTVVHIHHSLDTLTNDISALLPTGPATILSETEKAMLLPLWYEFSHQIFELDLIKTRYASFAQLSHKHEREAHERAFLLAYSAQLSEHTSLLTLQSLINERDTLNKILNEPGADNAIPANTYTTLVERLTLPEELLRINAGRAYLTVIKQSSPSYELIPHAEALLTNIDGSLQRYTSLLRRNPLGFFERQAFDLWFPVQKEIAVQMSHIRATDRPYVITKDVIDTYRYDIEPGDILLERRTWHITNIGIPGFWPHAALYIGTPEDINYYFADLPMLGRQDPMSYLHERYPEAVAKYIESPTHGFAHAVIEAKRPGVIFNSLDDSANADALAVLRPKLSQQEKFEAILHAFGAVGKPYDFNFDFATDSALVCSELVYKSYGAHPEIFPSPQMINGRAIMSPNDLAESIAKTYNTPDADFDVVLFLDIDEVTQTAVKQTTADFLESWQRPKWQLLTEAAEAKMSTK